MLNPAASLSAKKTGMQITLDFAGDEWRARVLEELRAWCAAQREKGATDMTMEQFRAVARNQGHSPKVWGPLAVQACKAGILAPLTHPDGSPVYRPAESVKTHGHPIRVYGLLAGASALNAPAARPATSHDSQAPQAQRQEPALDGRGSVLHAGSGAELLGVVAAFHEEREAR